MAKKSFLLVSLNESKAKKLAEVISNNTCRNVLDYLSEKKDATESDIAKDLNIPISTVHYNMKALVDAKLVKSDEYHYSEKGKEVNHYKLANQYVIIAPEGEKEAIKEKLKSILPAALIMGATAGIIKLFSDVFLATKDAATDSAPMLMQAAVEESSDAAPVLLRQAKTLADDAMLEAAPTAAPAAAEMVQETTDLAGQAASQAPEIALWFFIGAISGIAIYLLIEFIRKKLRERREK